ncbi:MAG: hypothetical protein QOF36_2007 [Microbacteriaceae bacterium]|jgi:hypothetical protein|nr:hypothetical protein [Microbacteriaceae bacterium]
MTSMIPAADSWNVRLVGHCDLGGHGDAMHINVTDDGYAYVGHMGDSRVGTSIVDVREPSDPRLVAQLETPVGTHSHKVQVVGDLLAVNYERNPSETSETWEAGVRIFDISDREHPAPVGFFATPGKGVHRLTYWNHPYAFVSGSDDGYTDQFLQIVDLTDPAHPVETGRWWFPGMHTAGGEKPSWPENRRVAVHHAIVRGDRAYVGMWDGGLVILDISDLTRPSMISHLEFDGGSGATHTALPLPGRDVLVVTDEAISDGDAEPHKRVRMVDISDETNPVVLGLVPIPEGDFVNRGGRFGPHNIHENRPGSFQSSDRIYLTYFNGGLRVLDVSDPTAPTEIAYCVPEAPRGRPAIQFNDIFVDRNGLIYASDRFTGGLYIMELDLPSS